MNPREELEKGVELLRPILEPYGFHFVFESGGNSSGGNFAQGVFVSGNRRLKLSFRWSLGCVEYQVSGQTITHAEYMEAIDKKREASYPGFSNMPITAFEHLRSDISQYCGTFVNGNDDEFMKIIKAYRAKPKKSGFAALSEK
ncbi:hypothetical protein [Methylomonas rivi]|uniref:DUF4304 domain-containing protein n=1 Tax=Methylomonas rivi TaxID=2952226 RepID=A0ABT1U6A8_9GAMM|nr:hypothetical protein [Methylomonas sp. WSC-6]MCQ8129391.1 hypothetical protein [Methylomonas sp. WSC-6]